MLKEGNQLDGIVFVGSRQVDILEVDDEALALLGTIDSSLRVRGNGAHCVQLLDDGGGSSLCIAVNDCHLSGLHLLNQTGNDQVLTATFRTAENKVLILIKQGLNYCDILLDRWCQNERRLLCVCKVLEL